MKEMLVKWITHRTTNSKDLHPTLNIMITVTTLLLKKKEHIPWNENLSKNPYSSVQIDPGSSPFKIISKKDKISFHPDTKDLIWRGKAPARIFCTFWSMKRVYS